MRCVWEHNGHDTLLYAVDYIGAYTRGENLDAAIGKMQREAASHLDWKNEPAAQVLPVEIVQEKDSDLQIADADSDVIFETETAPLS